MGQLHAYLCVAVAPEEFGDMLEFRLLFIVPQSRAARRYSPGGFDPSGLNKH